MTQCDSVQPRGTTCIDFPRSCVVCASGFGGRVFVSAGEYHENLMITQDVKIEATESAKGKVMVTFITTRSDVPILDIKVRFAQAKYTHSSFDCAGIKTIAPVFGLVWHR